MTAPIQEPTNDRALQGFAYQRDQLLRRPATPQGLSVCIAFHAGSQSISGGTSDAIVWDTINANDARFEIGGSGDYITAPAGFYLLFAAVGNSGAYNAINRSVAIGKVAVPGTPSGGTDLTPDTSGVAHFGQYNGDAESKQAEIAGTYMADSNVSLFLINADVSAFVTNTLTYMMLIRLNGLHT